MASCRFTLALFNYNHAGFLEARVHSLLSQMSPEDEFLIYDDASQDESPVIIAKLMRAHPQIRTIFLPQNRGVVANVNDALREARGHYIYLASADDMASPSFIPKSLRLLEAYPEAAFCCANFSFLSNSRCIEHPLAMGDRERYFSPTDFIRLLARREDVSIPHITVLYRRETLAEGYYETLRWHSDWFAYTSLALRHGFCFCPEKLAMVRQDTASYSHRGMRRHSAQAIIVKESLRILKAPIWNDVRPFFRAPALWSFAPRMRILLLLLTIKDPRFLEFFSLPLVRAVARDFLRKPLWDLLWPLLRPLKAAHPWKRSLLRLFGAKVGKGALIGPGLCLDRPWNLELGKESSLGADVVIVARETVSIGIQAVVDHDARLLTRNWDEKYPSTQKTAAIVIGNGFHVGAGQVIPAGTCVSNPFASDF